MAQQAKVLVKLNGKWQYVRVPSKPPQAIPCGFKVTCIFDATRVTLVKYALTPSDAVKKAKRDMFGKGAWSYECADMLGNPLLAEDVTPKTQAELDRDRLNHRIRMQGGLL